MRVSHRSRNENNNPTKNIDSIEYITNRTIFNTWQEISTYCNYTYLDAESIYKQLVIKSIHQSISYKFFLFGERSYYDYYGRLYQERRAIFYLDSTKRHNYNDYWYNDFNSNICKDYFIIAIDKHNHLMIKKFTKTDASEHGSQQCGYWHISSIDMIHKGINDILVKLVKNGPELCSTASLGPELCSTASLGPELCLTNGTPNNFAVNTNENDQINIMHDSNEDVFNSFKARLPCVNFSPVKLSEDAKCMQAKNIIRVKEMLYMVYLFPRELVNEIVKYLILDEMRMKIKH